VGGTSYSLTSTATVALDGTINLSMKMSQSLQNALLTALSEGNTVDFSLSAFSNDSDYSIRNGIYHLGFTKDGLWLHDDQPRVVFEIRNQQYPTDAQQQVTVYRMNPHRIAC
jgi:hypothetical protein